MNKYSSVRVGVAGVTGYAGLELLRRLARHPHAEVRYAMASSASESKRLPALARIWDAPVEPLDVDKLGATRTPCSSRCPTRSPRNSRRRSWTAARGCSIFQARSGCATSGCGSSWYPHSPSSSRAGRLRADRAAPPGARRARGSSRAPGAIRPRRCLALSPLVAGDLLEPGIIIDAKSGISGAGKTPTERTHFSECHGSISAYGVFAHRHAAEIEQELGTPVTFVPHLVPLDRGIFETIYARLRPGIDEAAVAAALTPGVRELSVRPADGRRLAGDQARRAHELLRHRLAGAGQSARHGRRASTTWSRGRPARRFRISTWCSDSTRRRRSN